MAVEVPTLAQTMPAPRNPLEQFVHGWCPVVSKQATQWRRDLAAAIDYALQEELKQRSTQAPSAGTETQGFSITRSPDGFTVPPIMRMLNTLHDEPDNSDA